MKTETTLLERSSNDKLWEWEISYIKTKLKNNEDTEFRMMNRYSISKSAIKRYGMQAKYFDFSRSDMHSNTWYKNLIHDYVKEIFEDLLIRNWNVLTVKDIKEYLVEKLGIIHERSLRDYMKKVFGI